MASEGYTRQQRRAAERAAQKARTSRREPRPEPAYPVGRLNIYVCETCRGHIVTRDRDAGVTPFMVGCRATPGCDGMMKSSMYRVFDQSMAESHEWYRPDSGPEGLSPGLRAHVEQGGLLLRPVAANAPQRKESGE